MPYKHRKSFLLKAFLLCLFSCVGFESFSQIDLRYSLSDLQHQLKTARNDRTKIEISINIGNFFLTNKERYKAMADSASLYASIAENLNTGTKDPEGRHDLLLLKVKVLIWKGQLAEVQKMIDHASGTIFCEMHALAGNYFLEKPGEDKIDLANAERHFLASQQYAIKKGFPNVAMINMVYLYNLMVESHSDGKLCDQYLNRIVALCRANHTPTVEVKAMQAKAIHDLYHYNLPAGMYKAATVAKFAGNIPVEAFCLKEIGDYHLRQGNVDSAEARLKQVVNIYNSIGYKNLQFTYDLLAAVSIVKGNVEQAMRYSILAVKNAEQTGTDISLNTFYSRLANLCSELGLHRQSSMWYRKWRESALRAKVNFPYQAYSAMAIELIDKGKARQVLTTLDSAQKAFRNDASIVYQIPRIKADCYEALHKPDSVEYYDLRIIKNVGLRGMQDYVYYSGYKRMAGFYIKQQEFEKAAPYIDTILKAGKPVVSAVDMSAVYLYQYKIDSARGRYLNAIKNFKISKDISDSIFAAVRVKQTERLQLQYATAERDRENLILRNKNTLQYSALEKGDLQRKMVTIALVAFIMVSGLMAYLYHVKQKSNTLLKLSQQEINEQNYQLKASQEEINVQNEHLKISQDEINLQNVQLNQLVQDKEWLIKEIHHRVKNNLQIISSLLNTQSSYLDNEQAVAAIRDSQNRMQAISIVHQKLYQSNDLATINIQVYIKELAASILDSFNTAKSITFNIHLIDAFMNTAQTVPLGLILNETITNSVKYAFDGMEAGIISITSSITSENLYELTIADNGKGLPDDFDMYACHSLGINLIIGLTEQLRGQLHIGSANGTIIKVAFPM